MEGPLSTAFRDASRFLVETVRHVPHASWDGPGLGDWTLRELVAHATRGHTTVADYLLHPQEPEQPGSDYFTDQAIAARGREAVLALAHLRAHHPHPRHWPGAARRPVRPGHRA
jgi:hypothetical protein